MYTIKFTLEAEKQLDKLELDVQIRILTVLERVSIRPFHYAKRLVGTDKYRFRAGDYRIIVAIEQNIMTIIVLELGHRRNIYKE